MFQLFQLHSYGPASRTQLDWPTSVFFSSAFHLRFSDKRLAADLRKGGFCAVVDEKNMAERVLEDCIGVLENPVCIFLGGL